MELRFLARPAAQLLASTGTARCPAAALGPLVPARGHQTAARTKRALKIAPHDSFLPDRSAVFPGADAIIYNPPASEASPAHTPFLFLPPNDPRRLALLRLRQKPGAPGAPIPGAVAADLPPAMSYPRRQPRYHLSEADMAEMRRLRAEDPIKWSVGHLAKKFDCSSVFVRMVAPATSEHLEWLKSKLERKMSRWGPKKVQARDDRKRRAEMLYRGEL